MRILAVDDEGSVLKLLATVLQKDRHDVIAANSGDEALKICKELGQTLDLVITDVNMPGMTGIELAECVSALPHRMRVIVMSGYPESSPKVLALSERLGSITFLPKPFTIDDLRKVIAESMS